MSQESYLDERGRSWTRDEMRAQFAAPPSTELSLNTYQRSLHTYKNRHHECHALGLSGEVGEVLSELREARDAAIAAGNVADMVKKATAHGVPLDRAKLKKELGDVLWYITAVASDNKLTLQEIAEANIAKLRERYPEGFVKGGGVRGEINRAEHSAMGADAAARVHACPLPARHEGECPPLVTVRCQLPPAGWSCTREGGHDGPCAAIEEGRLLQPVIRLAPTTSLHRHAAHAVHFSCGCCETTVDGILHRKYCPNGECRRLGR